LFFIVDWAGGFGAAAGGQGKAELVEEWAGMEGVIGQTDEGQSEDKKEKPKADPALCGRSRRGRPGREGRAGKVSRFR
jgi:hypothetical protein